MVTLKMRCRFGVFKNRLMKMPNHAHVTTDKNVMTTKLITKIVNCGKNANSGLINVDMTVIDMTKPFGFIN